MSTDVTSTYPDLLAFLKKISPERLRRAPRTRRAQYPSPGANYKPVLLLSALHRVYKALPLYRQGIVRYAPCTEDFSSIYDACYGIGASTPVQPKVTQAFWYLGAGTPRIWTLIPNEGQEEELELAIRNKEQVKQQPRLLELVSHAEIPQDLMALLKDRIAARAIMAYIMQEFFPPLLHELLDRALSKLK